MHSDPPAILIQQVHVFNLAFDQSTAILIQQVDVFNLGIYQLSSVIIIIVHVFPFDWSNVPTLYHYKVTLSSASLCIIMPFCCLSRPALMTFSWFTTSSCSLSSTFSVSELSPTMLVALPQSVMSSLINRSFTSLSLSVMSSCSISTCN